MQKQTYKEICSAYYLRAILYINRCFGRYSDAGNRYENWYYQPYHWNF